ncbi:MAG TPA: cellulase family glycosylhydrolase [Candidatus Hydrogenedentes bacterium]|nr:cellulase family glycosylhydrolase [Candidatus Hydrogenedentota bacterium]HPG69277.1 cellulase family glycosylhydrolase [Candidatus Hydrogenedentota bacterium]
MKHGLLATLLLLAPALAVSAAELPECMFPDAGLWGVVVHTPFHAQALKDIGVQWVRVNLRWRNIETGQRGQYDWAGADELLGCYVDNGFKVMAILTIENLCPLYESDAENKQVVIDAIAQWAGAAAARYSGKGLVWEIGNEPEVFPMGDYWNHPETYTAMARKVAGAIKAADADARVAALSVAWFDRGFISKALDDGLIADGTVDILTYHGYHRRDLMPESGLAEDVAWLREQVGRYAPSRKPVILADSERGYAIVPFLEPKAWHSWRNLTYGESEQAAYLARHYLETISLGVEIGVWYKDMRGESCFSLYYGTEEDAQGLRPIGHVYRNLAALLPENPKKLVNNRHAVSLVDLPDKQSAPDGSLTVRTYLRSYLKEGAGQARLVVAVWNPIEAFDGRILDNRKRIGDDFYEAWRAIAPDDPVLIPTEVHVDGVDAGHVVSAAQYDLLATSTDAATQPVEFTGVDGGIQSPRIEVGPMPTVFVVDIRE